MISHVAVAPFVRHVIDAGTKLVPPSQGTLPCEIRRVSPSRRLDNRPLHVFPPVMWIVPSPSPPAKQYLTLISRPDLPFLSPDDDAQHPSRKLKSDPFDGN